MYSKMILASKTFWLNAITLVLAFLTTLTGSDMLDPEIVVYIVGLIIPILNIILRFFTSQPVTLTPKQ